MSHEAEGVEVMMDSQDLRALLTAVDALAGGATILEYGSGGSTRIFANHLGDDLNLFSVEHNNEWFLKVGDMLKDHPVRDRVQRVLAPLDFHPGLWRFARPEEEMAAGAKHYIWAPDTYHVDWSKVGMALVDGIARGPCLAYLLTRLNPGTPVFLHDYKGRETWYDWAVNLYTFVAQHDLTIELRSPTK
jgi:hypothetical protein